MLNRKITYSQNLKLFLSEQEERFVRTVRTSLKLVWLWEEKVEYNEIYVDDFYKDNDIDEINLDFAIGIVLWCEHENGNIPDVVDVENMLDEMCNDWREGNCVIDCDKFSEYVDYCCGAEMPMLLKGFVCEYGDEYMILNEIVHYCEMLNEKSNGYVSAMKSKSSDVLANILGEFL